ncbi:MAG TPA: hypothetical protein VGB66_03320, partial [Longimicrobium sp.]
MLEPQAAVRELAEAEAEILVHRPGPDDAPVRDRPPHLLIVHPSLHGDVRVRQDALEHARVAVQRHRLEGVGEVA